MVGGGGASVLFLEDAIVSVYDLVLSLKLCSCWRWRKAAAAGEELDSTLAMVLGFMCLCWRWCYDVALTECTLLFLLPNYCPYCC